jgi:hypothetical protein
MTESFFAAGEGLLDSNVDEAWGGGRDGSVQCDAAEWMVVRLKEA